MDYPDTSRGRRRVARRAPPVMARQDYRPNSAAEGFAQDVIGCLSTDLHSGPWPDTCPVSAQSSAAFCETLLRPEPDAALAFVAARRAEGMTRQAIHLTYVCDGARWLGLGWDQDRLSFLDVTVGVGHLCALMRALRAEADADRMRRDSRRCALFATVPGEQHCLGVTVAAAVFRDHGWHIDLHTDTEHDSLLDHIRRSACPVIGLSISTGRSVHALARLVASVRRVAPQIIIGVAYGQTPDRDALSDAADIDLIFDDAEQACAQLDRLIRVRSGTGRMNCADPSRRVSGG